MSSSSQSTRPVSQEPLFVENKEDNSWVTTHDHLAKFAYSHKEVEEVFIPAGTVYSPTEWVMKEETVVDEPTTVDVLSFSSDDRFG